ncbi:MAG TPA: hypothetical protein VH062_01385 [Polyangiaceae bacterium]|jgi:hypothetical protein|nr:hypothetical protein [Polyangiaceae bacterium]
MTIGFVATHLGSGEASFLLAADCRLSFGHAKANVGIKTYALGPRVGAVAAGNALSASTAAELTRGISEDHDRAEPDKRINFYSTVRLYAYLLNRVELDNPWSDGCEVAIAGFLSNGTPALAKVTTAPSRRAEVHLYAPKRFGSLILMVGRADAKEQIFGAIARDLRESGARWIAKAVGTIAYLCEHEGERTIGGAPSVAVCSQAGPVYWPLVVDGDRTYLRGLDITEYAPASKPFPGDDRLHLQYDQTWHSQVDRDRGLRPMRVDEGFIGLSHYVDEWLSLKDIFEWRVDPDAFALAPDPTLPPEYVAIVQPGELSGFLVLER